MSVRAINRLAFIGLCVLLAWAPLPFASNVLWAEMLLCLILFLLTLITLSTQLRPQVAESRISSQALWALVALGLAHFYLFLQLLPFLLFGQLQYKGFFINSIEPHATAVMLLSGIALCCAFYLVLVTVTSEKRARLLLLVVVCSGVFQASYGAAMTLSGMEYGFFMEKTAYRGMATGTFVNRNHLAGYLVLILAAGIGLMIAGFHYRKLHSFRQFCRSFLEAIISGKGALRIGLIIMVIALVLTRSRMGNASFFIGLTLAGIAIMIYARVSKKTIGLFLVSILVIDALIISSFFDLDKLAQRLESTSAETENRDEILRLSLPMVRENLWFGAGGGSFYTNYPAYREASAGGGFYMHAHNDYIEFLSERGLIGCIPVVIFYLLCMRQAAQLLKSRSIKKRGLAFTVLMSGIAIALHSTVDFNLQMPAYAMTLVVVWALSFSNPYLRKSQKPIL